MARASQVSQVPQVGGATVGAHDCAPVPIAVAAAFCASAAGSSGRASVAATAPVGSVSTAPASCSLPSAAASFDWDSPVSARMVAVSTWPSCVATTRAPDLLSVGIHGGADLRVEDEADIWFVDPHAEGDGGDDHFAVIRHEGGLRLRARSGAHPGVVSRSCPSSTARIASRWPGRRES